MSTKNLPQNNIGKYIALVLRSLVISTFIVATYSKIPIPTAKTSEPEVIGWTDSSWLYRKSITVSNDTGNTLTNEDVQLTVDTSSMVSSGILQSNCNDLRFTDSDGTTYLNYWIEDGCNTSTTNVWFRIPSLPGTGKTVYMYYGNSSATSDQMTWGGNIYMYADTSCPSGWTQASDLNNRFLYGSDTFGNTGGTNTASPGDVACTSSSVSTSSISGISTGSGTGTTITHTHTNLKTTLNSASMLPPYENMVVCYNNHFTITTGLISLFTTTQASNWTRFSALDNIFARANSTYGTTGGSSTHTHTASLATATDTPTGTSSTVTTQPFSATGGTITYSGGYTIHTFTSSGTFTASGSGNVEILVVGGGGGGGYNSAYSAGGGGGAGGCLYQNSFAFTSGSYTVTVGNGGAKNANGQNSSVSSLTAIGGGHGGVRSGQTIYAQDGGSGGGGSYCCAAECIGGKGTTGQGYDGGSSPGTNSAGGGGCGGAGANQSTGGIGASYSISGSTVCYGGGGGGSSGSATCGGGSSANGTANTGGGGAGGNHSGGSGIVIIKYPTAPTLSGTIATLDHTHSVSSVTVSTVSNLPPYMTMLFEKADSNQYVNENNLVITSVLPPLGWNRYTQLDNKFVMGSDTPGTTGGSATNTHSVAISTGAPSATTNVYGTGSYFADSTHTHSCSATSSQESNIPEYYSVIYAQRKTSLDTLLGTQQVFNTAPYAPSDLLTEELYNPAGITDLTPEFSARFSDTNASDTGNYYQIEVNTNSSFTGTIMWDTQKTAFASPLTNNTRSTNITYAGSTLQPGATYYWRMKFWDNNSMANESDWSTTYQFSVDNTPTALSTNISGTDDIYAGKAFDITSVYSDEDGSPDLSKLYLQIKNSLDTNIEYYATTDGFNQESETPSNVTGSEYISNISYDLTTDSPTSDDITVVWHITPGWNWSVDSNIQYGTKASDMELAESQYSYTSTVYKYENRLSFAGTLGATDSESNAFLSGDWTKANSTINFSGLTVVYANTSNIYPNAQDFNVEVSNETSQTWSDNPLSGEEILLSVTTGDDTNTSDIYAFSITNIPTGGQDISDVSFTIRTDNTLPLIDSLTSSSHPNQTIWYSSRNITMAWSVSDADSGIYKVWRLIDQTETQTAANIQSSGVEISNSGTYQTTITNDGTWYIHIAAMDNQGLVQSGTYKINIDTLTPTFLSVTSSTHPVQTRWYTTKSAVIAWTTSDSGSGVLGVWKLLNQNKSQTITNVLTSGTQLGANTSTTTAELTDGIWYLHLVVKDNSGKTTYTRYTIQIDSSTPNIVAVTGDNNNILQNRDSGPIISWTDPSSLSNDIFYITNNEQTPTSSNYTYTTNNPTYDLPKQTEGETVIKVRALNGAGTYSETRTFTIQYDSTAPANVKDFKATSSQSSVILSWKNPTASDFTRVIIVKSESNIPSSLTDGIKIYEGNLTTYTDSNVLAGKKYYYTIFAQDILENTSSGTTFQTATTSDTTQVITPVINEDTKVVKVQTLSETAQPSVTANEQNITTTDLGELHVYTQQTVNIQIPASTVLENTTDTQQVVLLLDNQTYLMKYNSQNDTYMTVIDTPSIKGAYDTKIATVSQDNTSQLAITMSLLVDPYGYIYAKSGNNELRIAGAKISLYTKVNSQAVLWSATNGSTNPQYTNDSGEYQFLVQPGEYKIVVEAKGYITTETEWFTVTNNIVEKNIELKCSPYLLYVIIGVIEVSAFVILFIVSRKKRSHA